VAVGFARYLGVLFPSISPTTWIISSHFARFETGHQCFHSAICGDRDGGTDHIPEYAGRALGKLIQNIFTSAKTLSLLGLILIGVFIGRNHEQLRTIFQISGLFVEQSRLSLERIFLRVASDVDPASGFFGLAVAFGVSQVGSLFSADA